MASLLDIHKYSIKAFESLYENLSKNDFNKAYINKQDPITAVTGVLWDITQGDKVVTDIIKRMDEIDKVKSEKEPTKLEKITSTWLKKAYKKHFIDGVNISRSLYLKFVKYILKPATDEDEKSLNYSATKIFDKIYATHRMKQNRAKESKKLDEIKAKYKHLHIDEAYRYMLATNKFALNNDDIEEFDALIQILLKKYKNTKTNE